MPQILAISGLVIATLLYFMLVRRRSSVRSGIQRMSRARSASNEVALSRIRGGLRAAVGPPKAVSGDGIRRGRGERGTATPEADRHTACSL